MTVKEPKARLPDSLATSTLSQRTMPDFVYTYRCLGAAAAQDLELVVQQLVLAIELAHALGLLVKLVLERRRLRLPDSLLLTVDGSTVDR